MSLRNHWRKTDKTIGGYKAVEHKVNMSLPGAPAEYEIALYGRYGYIFEFNSDQYAAVITAPKLANKLAKSMGRRGDYSRGDEALFRFSKDMLPVFIVAIKMPRSHATRVRLANTFSERNK